MEVRGFPNEIFNPWVRWIAGLASAKNSSVVAAVVAVLALPTYLPTYLLPTYLPIYLPTYYLFDYRIYSHTYWLARRLSSEPFNSLCGVRASRDLPPTV